MVGLRLLECCYHPGQNTPPHVHATASFCLVLHGRFLQTHREESLLCEPHSLLFYRPGEPHAEQFHAVGARCFILELSSSWLDRFSELDEHADSSGSLVTGRATDLARRAYQEFREPDPHAPLMVEGLTLELLAEVLRQGSTSLAPPRPGSMERARDLIEAAQPGSISLARIAAELGLHPVHVAHQFRRTYGCSVCQYARQLRLELACRRIARSREPLAEIAVESGFYDQSHMTREFRRTLKTTPARYRETVRAR
jgi:AraC family transcriptional regulator